MEKIWKMLVKVRIIMVVFKEGLHMIAAMADACVFDMKVEGDALRFASALRVIKTGAAFIGGLSSDCNGQKIIDALIKEEILFDPSLIFSSLPTLQESVPLESTAFAHISASLIEEVLTINSDIRLLYVSPLTLATDEVAHAVADAILRLAHPPILLLDTRTSTIAEDVLNQLLPLSLFVVGDQILDDYLGFQLLASSQSLAVVAPGGARIDCPLRSDFLASLAAFASLLHERGCFGSDGGFPTPATCSQKEVFAAAGKCFA